jgi:hypothetical protein
MSLLFITKMQQDPCHLHEKGHDQGSGYVLCACNEIFLVCVMCWDVGRLLNAVSHWKLHATLITAWSHNPPASQHHPPPLAFTRLFSYFISSAMPKVRCDRWITSIIRVPVTTIWCSWDAFTLLLGRHPTKTESFKSKTGTRCCFSPIVYCISETKTCLFFSCLFFRKSLSFEQHSFVLKD